MKQVIISTIICCISCFIIPKTNFAEVILLDSLCADRGSGYTMQTKIVTCETNGVRKSHFAYCGIEPEHEFIPWESLSAWIATYNHDKKKIESRTFLGYIHDNHGSPCLTADKEGYLHVVYGPHHHPFIYQKSKYPNNSTEWENKEIISFEYGQIDIKNPYWQTKKFIEKEGKSEWTYPIIKIDQQNRIHVAGSLSHSAAYVRKVDGQWEQPRVIYHAKKPLCRYNVMMNIDGNNHIYILAPDVEIKSNEQNYMQLDTDYYLFQSDDSGDTFKNHGEVISGYIQGNGNLAVDSNGHIHFLCMSRSLKRKGWQYHTWYDSMTWQKQKLEIPGRYIWDSSMTIDNDDNIYIFSTANKSDRHWRDATNEIFLFAGKPAEKKSYVFSYKKIVSNKPERNRWLPAIEINQVHSDFNKKGFFLMWTEEPDLKGDYTKPEHKKIKTNIYFQKMNMSDW